MGVCWATSASTTSQFALQCLEMMHGVLVDSELPAQKVLVEALAQLGFQMSVEEAIHKYRGCKMAECVLDIEKIIGQKVPEGFVEEVRARTAIAFQRELRAIDGIIEVLNDLTIPICVASSGPRSKIELSLRLTGLSSFFENKNIFSSYEIGSWKPEPDIFLHAATKMGFEPDDCAVIEDSALGVRAGIAAGMKVFGFVPQERRVQLEAEGATAFSSMSQLKALFEVI
jgi:HAD superfamily hydrolase (TIGR01509 family)